MNVRNPLVFAEVIASLEAGCSIEAMANIYGVSIDVDYPDKSFAWAEPMALCEGCEEDRPQDDFTHFHDVSLCECCAETRYECYGEAA